MHIGEDINIIELIDDHGNPVRRGEPSSRILVTNLSNRVMPLIRYEITDEFQLAEAPCPCGSAYLSLADVQGRSDDVFVYPNGVRVHPLNFRSVLGKDPAIVEYQVRQTERGAEVMLVGRSQLVVEAIQSALQNRLAGLGVSEPCVTAQQIDKIERQSTGKLKRFIPLPR
jgi:phenylacetate-coenzyme A ligase PaaK-like adenylate-forming protein